MSGMHLSKEFFELLKAIGESKSKQEEDRIIQREIGTLKKKMEAKVSKVSIGNNPPQNQLNANKKKAKEFLDILKVTTIDISDQFGARKVCLPPIWLFFLLQFV